MTRRPALLTVIIGVLLLAGCTGTLDDQSPTTDRSTGSTTTSSLIPENEATERALEAETNYVSAHLQNASCLSYWEIGEFTASAEATVTNRTEHGTVVNVQRPYSWAQGESVADGVSNARYFVTENETIRRSGPSISPC